MGKEKRSLDIKRKAVLVRKSSQIQNLLDNARERLTSKPLPGFYVFIPN